ncbi:glycine dehydrogenase (decarboxylating) related protein, subunit 2 [Thermoplasma acidophilum]|uniref:Probable glycine dehydrogenase (decarboxylating) subunit 2 n=1 Tax=Thermoplasma acidophilum (strain ATCC 25905 / DSM 1728 / JCM 9062 / NBRC 15155 / AMRC-C165) TaxID=273075 RepID=GCSPB_THEAC|nr:aminomethyl-transferring glycine dehydrogenase subunit GcvPB [Thermoplasma acidophilum]Q9HII2.1 RecName: Full=Probable glycine dehydrogenase (decarboxylating) subunit 2; AltName: Full=Glycine cleavage system P-protein subunit 2; AltName: Full=Glycine decarboxylase subunit 2; AltName: Full=Glycine dehydrogenase (aminomethyl-transferring) subunit 2 [Thermoplasma acidophilum DSM 1728]CAC12478.1 glycine dehydrogenase (decarboxylating) related protein, subunit 2 [Thermoplasma acidophilum]
MEFRQAYYDEPLIKDIKSDTSFKLSEDVDENLLPQDMRRTDLKLPQVSEVDVVRHYTRLSQMNYTVDVGIYPLGSCTMKYNPKYADRIASFAEFRNIHPFQPESTVQGTLQIMYELQEFLKKISDMDAVTLQPMAGADGEFTGILIIKKYFEDLHEDRTEIIVPDSAHGTNPASATMGGFDVVEIPSNSEGMVDLNALKAAISKKTAALMITNPNTLGIFEQNITEIAKILHDAGALLYYDGANLNAIFGITSPGLMGFDIVHFNLHKSFATPHGGGGPGAGPVAVKSFLSDFLPVPVVGYDGKRYFLDYGKKKSIGRVSSFYGSFSILLRAWSYVIRNGDDGLKNATIRAVLNSNYLKKKVEGYYEVPYYPLKKHEFVLSTEKTGRRALDIGKYLLDFGIHSPTVYFPLIVKEAMMIEPTETVSKDDLDRYADVLISALKVPEDDLKSRPRNTAVSRIDEVKAARDLKVRW